MTNAVLVFLICKNEMNEIRGDVFSFEFHNRMGGCSN
jgi:hypothetical protein